MSLILSFIYCIFILLLSFLSAFHLITVKLGILNYIGGIFFLSFLYHFLFYLPSFIFHRYCIFFIIVGVLSRIFFSFSLPLWEDDWARYLWEGNLMTRGISPYSYPPEIFFTETNNFILTDKDLEILSRINHPDWSAIYSPIVLLYFYVCALFSPFSLSILKLGYLFMDLIIFWILKSMKNKKNAVLYFLFPVLIKEIYINSHFEMIVIFLFIISIWWQRKKYFNLSSIFFGMAVHSKVYLICMLPFFIVRNSFRINRNEVKVEFILRFIFYFLIGLLFPVGILELIVSNNSYYGLDTIFKFGNNFEFNSLYFYLLKKIITSESLRNLLAFSIFIYMIYSIFIYKIYFLKFKKGISWSFNLFLTYLLFSPIVNPWYFLILLPLYFLLFPNFRFLWIVPLIPQISYLTIINLNINNIEYNGFYNIQDSIIYLEIICFTILILFRFYNKKLKAFL